MKTARCVCSLVVLRLTTLFTARGRGAVRPGRGAAASSDTSGICLHQPSTTRAAAALCCPGLFWSFGGKEDVLVCVCGPAVHVHVHVCVHVWRESCRGFFCPLEVNYVWLCLGFKKKGGKTHQDTKGGFFFLYIFIREFWGRVFEVKGHNPLLYLVWGLTVVRQKRRKSFHILICFWNFWCFLIFKLHLHNSGKYIDKLTVSKEGFERRSLTYFNLQKSCLRIFWLTHVYHSFKQRTTQVVPTCSRSSWQTAPASNTVWTFMVLS